MKNAIVTITDRHFQDGEEYSCELTTSGRFEITENGCTVIYNETDEDVISTRTTNYNFQGKALYCVSCCSAINLCPSLMQIGLKLYVGYNDTFEVKEYYSPFLMNKDIPLALTAEKIELPEELKKIKIH